MSESDVLTKHGSRIMIGLATTTVFVLVEVALTVFSEAIAPYEEILTVVLVGIMLIPFFYLVGSVVQKLREASDYNEQ